MKIVKQSVVGVLVILLLPVLVEAELLWFDDFEQDTVGGSAQGWGYPGTQYVDTTWKVVMDESTKVYRHCSDVGSYNIFAVGYDPPPVAFTAQAKIKVTDCSFDTSTYSGLSVGLCYGGNVECYFAPILDFDGKRGLFLSDALLNTPYFAYLPFDLEMAHWYYFKIGQSDTVNQHPPQIYFKVWPEAEEEPANWMIYPGPGGHYWINWWEYINWCVYLSESVCHQYIGLMAVSHNSFDKICANFDEIKVFSGSEVVEVNDEHDDQVVIPKALKLYQNYPNPFNHTTIIRYSISVREGKLHRTDLRIYNVLGEEVRALVNEEKWPGDYEVVWNGKDNQGKEVGSGVYFCRLQAGGFVATRKIILLR